MEYVKKNNGTTIIVYTDEESDDLKAIRNSGVVSFFAFADFSLNSSLVTYINEVCNINN